MFADTQELLGALALLFFFGLILHSLRGWSRQFASVSEAGDAGIDGGLLVIVGWCLGWGIFNLAALWLTTQAVSVLSVTADRVFAVLPAALAVAGCVWAGLRLLSGRRPRVVAEAVAALCAAGPVAEALAIADGTGDMERLIWVGALTAVFCLYLIFAPRARNTYGAFLK